MILAQKDNVGIDTQIIVNTGIAEKPSSWLFLREMSLLFGIMHGQEIRYTTKADVFFIFLFVHLELFNKKPAYTPITFFFSIWK